MSEGPLWSSTGNEGGAEPGRGDRAAWKTAAAVPRRRQSLTSTVGRRRKDKGEASAVDWLRQGQLLGHRGVNGGPRKRSVHWEPGNVSLFEKGSLQMLLKDREVRTSGITPVGPKNPMISGVLRDREAGRVERDGETGVVQPEARSWKSPADTLTGNFRSPQQ